MADDTPQHEFLPAPPPVPPADMPAHPAYLDAPPPADAAAVRAFRRRLRWRQWLLIPIGAVSAWLLVASVMHTTAPKDAQLSPDYAGAPVEPSDASDTTVVSDDATIAYEIGAEWVVASDYVDLDSAIGSLGEDGSLTAAHFTADPTVTTPQLVMVMAYSPTGPTQGTVEDFLEGYLDGARDSGVDFERPVPAPVTTANGLEGYSVEFAANAAGNTANVKSVALGHGSRVVLVQWDAYQEPVDEVALQALLDTLRIDKDA